MRILTVACIVAAPALAYSLVHESSLVPDESLSLPQPPAAIAVSEQQDIFVPSQQQQAGIAAVAPDQTGVAAPQQPRAILVAADQTGVAAPQQPRAILAAADREQASVPASERQPIRRPVKLAALGDLQGAPGQDDPSFEDHYPVPAAAEPDLSYLADYVYSEVPPARKPADVVLAAFKDIPIGTPVEEIRRAANAFGLDVTFMEAVAKIESSFDPKARTGSYIGLFQLSNYEFQKYGSGEITNPRDNAVAAAYKFATASIMFELDTHKKATPNDLYLIHQQGTQGAAEHVSHPERVAWQSMCATDEGRVKGERWCKRAIWLNTLPTVKALWKSVDKLTSGAFVDMWRERVDHFYARYAATAAAP